MKKNIILIGCSLMMVFVLAGCGNKKTQLAEEKSQDVVTTMSEAVTTEKDRGSRTEEATTEAKHQEQSRMIMMNGEMVMIPAPTVVEKPEDIAKAGEAFETIFDEGLYYTIDKAVFYDNVEDAGLKREDMRRPENMYEGEKYNLGEKYLELEDIVKEDGSLDEAFKLLVLDITGKNENAVGMENDCVFLINSLELYGGEPVTRYGVAYFSEQGKADSVQIWHYTLQQGEELKAKVAFFILKEDVNDLVGIVNKNEYGENETYFEIY